MAVSQIESWKLVDFIEDLIGELDSGREVDDVKE